MKRKHTNKCSRSCKKKILSPVSRSAAEEMKLITISYSNFKQIHSVSVTYEHKYVFDEKLIGLIPGEFHFNTESGTPD